MKPTDVRKAAAQLQALQTQKARDRFADQQARWRKSAGDSERRHRAETETKHKAARDEAAEAAAEAADKTQPVVDATSHETGKGNQALDRGMLAKVRAEQARRAAAVAAVAAAGEAVHSANTPADRSDALDALSVAQARAGGSATALQGTTASARGELGVTGEIAEADALNVAGVRLSDVVATLVGESNTEVGTSEVEGDRPNEGVLQPPAVDNFAEEPHDQDEQAVPRRAAGEGEVDLDPAAREVVGAVASPVPGLGDTLEIAFLPPGS